MLGVKRRPLPGSSYLRLQIVAVLSANAFNFAAKKLGPANSLGGGFCSLEGKDRIFNCDCLFDITFTPEVSTRS